MTQKSFEPKDYEALGDFLIELNKHSKEHINWNWAWLGKCQPHGVSESRGAFSFRGLPGWWNGDIIRMGEPVQNGINEIGQPHLSMSSSKSDRPQ